jgi:hypothetical protein
MAEDIDAEITIIRVRMTERAVAWCIADGMAEEDARAIVERMWHDPPPTSLPTFEKLGDACTMAPRHMTLISLTTNHRGSTSACWKARSDYRGLMTWPTARQLTSIMRSGPAIARDG